MRDGVKLYADIYRPAADGSYPVLLLRTPYNKEDAQTMNFAHPAWYARHGYVVVVQDTRGRWSSEGDFHPYEAEAEDGYDTIEWAAKLPGVVPKVGMYGFSYAAAAQWQAAITKPPHLRAIAPAMIGSDSYQGKAYRNGAFALALTQSWVLFVAQDTALKARRTDWASELSALYTGIHAFYKRLPLNDPPEAVKALAPYYEQWLEHRTRDDFWKRSSLSDHYDSINVPALHVGGWYDIFIDGTIENFNGIRRYGTDAAKDGQYLYIEPWFHMPWSRYVGELDFGPEAVNRIDELQLQWFGRWLKDEEPEAPAARVRYFLMGSNTWKEAETWPVPGAETKDYYLHSLRKANSVNGDGSLSQEPPGEEFPDLYVYHPSIPVPALGGRSGAVPDLTPMGPRNQLPIEVRNDVLVYTSAPLEHDLIVTGEVTVQLYAATTAEDTDFVAKLVDVYPDGRAVNIAEGIVRASFRSGLERPEAVPPDQVLIYTISLGPTANVFKQGHAIRLDVTSSLFPTFDRNPNRLMNPDEATEADFVTATQTIYHDARYPSKLQLPVIADFKGGEEGG
ncbi:X-Pro dipeptidyl-peptidase [Paenibacillus beijingensis]|uniref:X-Pro dipeptidyl-peptidase n=2 Tax=Paenibacillus beijingensis TaxID=1126833 RepID=A0A0D5NS33_9BACL|nr:X-Pro dipeptidyl-peptidase [Paenibacillus beijingensis]